MKNPIAPTRRTPSKLWLPTLVPPLVPVTDDNTAGEVGYMVDDLPAGYIGETEKNLRKP